MAANHEHLKLQLFDRMFEISKQEDLQYLQQYFIHPENIIDITLLSHERFFEYLQFALTNTSFEKKFA